MNGGNAHSWQLSKNRNQFYGCWGQEGFRVEVKCHILKLPKSMIEGFIYWGGEESFW